jgi:hypothetical protein
VAKKPANPTLSPAQSPEPMFVTWNDEAGKVKAIANASRAISRNEPILRASGTNVFQNITPGGVSVRDGFDRSDYDLFRAGDAMPTKPKDVIRACMNAYDHVGIVKNTIDLMSDFACQGVDVVHPNERIEKFYKEWFRKVRGTNRSERFLNLLYRTGNVVIRRMTAKVSVRVEDDMKRASADPDMTTDQLVKIEKREVPWRYRFLSPLKVDVVADELSMFVGDDNYIFQIAISKTLASKIKNAKTPQEKALVARIPPEILKAVMSGNYSISLPPEKVRAFYYKKDDWDTWAKPMAHAILPDLQVLQKMKLADLAALDGAISCIRVWKLGNIEAKILPTEAAVNRLAQMLCNNVGGGVMDLVWGPELELVETSTEVHRFLGQTKYEPVLMAIHAGLGIPPTLTGSSGQSGFTNNFISIKTLIERLEYGRDVLREFWENEIRSVQQAMGFRFPASLVFDHMSLTDEATRMQLLISLADRNLISEETLRDIFGLQPDIEEIRVRRESRRRDTNLIPQKASPFHNPEKDFAYKKIFATAGVVAPSEIGVELEEKAPGQQSLFDKTAEETTKNTKVQNDHQIRTEKLHIKHGIHPNQLAALPKGESGEGRPKNSKDSKKRKQKTVNPRTSAEFLDKFAWAESTQTKINLVTSKAFLKSLKKNSLRELSDDEARNFEAYKFFLLCQFNPGEQIDAKAIASASNKELTIPEQVDEVVKAAVQKHVEKFGKEPTFEVVRRFQAGAVAFWKGDYEVAA